MREPTSGLIALAPFAGVTALVLAATGPFPELLDALGIPVTAHAGAATALLLVGTLSLPLCWQPFAGTLQTLWILRALATSEALLARKSGAQARAEGMLLKRLIEVGWLP